ncbi:hypothetical protein OAO60_01165 [bacterium]|nr:hypothetical protein [bacterium]
MDTKSNKISKIIGRSSAINIHNIGGTEEIARFLVKKEHAQIIKEESIGLFQLTQIIKSDKNKLFILGASKFFIIKLLLISSMYKKIAHIEYIKTSNKTNSKDLLIRFLLLNIYKRIYVTDLDGDYFSQFEGFRSSTIDISNLINTNFNETAQFKKNKLNFEERNIDIAYIGRVDVDKGFYHALDIFKDKRLSDCLKKMDLLLWDKDRESLIVSNADEELKISNIVFEVKEKVSNKPPKYDEVKIVILPYKNFDSTIRAPLVIFEALKAGCIVLLPSWIKKDGKFISIIDNFLNLNHISNSLFFFEPSINQTVDCINKNLEKKEENFE